MRFIRDYLLLEKVIFIKIIMTFEFLSKYFLAKNIENE